MNPLSVLPALKQLEFLLASGILIKLLYKGYIITTTSFVFWFSSFSRTVLGDVLDHLHCVILSWLHHLSGGLPGFLSLVEVEDVVER